MILNNLFIGIPIGAFFCFLFLFFCFLNMHRSKLVTYFRLILGTCILWSGGAMLMRLQLKPGAHFWFQISLLGLLLLPVCMYFFLFQTLEMSKKTFLNVYTVITVVVAAVNAVTGKIVATPQLIVGKDHSIGFTYTLSIGIFCIVIVEFLLLIYVTVLAHRKIGNDLKVRGKLAPLLYGTLLVFIGQIIEMLPDNMIPFGSLGGVLMALLFVFVLYQQSFFDISNRLLVGCVYTIAAVIIILPIWSLAKNIEDIQKLFSMRLSDTVFIFLLALTVWSLLVIYLAWKTAEGLSLRKKKEQFQYLYEFQSDTASLFNEEELYRKVINVIEHIFKDVHTLIFIRKDEDSPFLLVPTCEADYGVEKEEKERIFEIYQESMEKKRMEIAALQYDNKIQGFLYLKFPSKVRMNYTEVEYFNQVAAYTSICLKNISVYEEVYQNSIHDDLTGLYNRAYYKEFLEKYWMSYDPQSLIYLDLDDFKLFNELYGEEVGDEILKWSGQTILDTVGAKGATFRVGSNEFLVYSRYRKKDELIDMAHQIQVNLMREEEEKPKVLQPITMSIGIALYPDTASDDDELLKQAEQAAFFAKEDGKNCIKVYEVAVDEKDKEGQDAKSYEQIAPTIYALAAAIDAKDSYTFEHSIHVSEYAVLLAKKIGLSNDEVRIAKEAGLLHDIGKIGIPESILKKQGRLTDEEFAIMKTHVTNSIEMIHYLPNMNYVIPAVVSHHERYDGRGYPRGIAGEKIPLLGRVLTVCDCYDAMVSKRPYKDEMTIEYAVSELEKNKGTQFDPELAEAFISLIQEGKIG